MRRLEMLVNVLQSQTFGDHHHLEVVEQLGDFFGGSLVGFVFGSHPNFGGFLYDLLADAMNAGIQFGDGTRTFGTGLGLRGELLEESVKSFHILRVAWPIVDIRNGTPNVTNGIDWVPNVTWLRLMTVYMARCVD